MRPIVEILSSRLPIINVSKQQDLSRNEDIEIKSSQNYPGNEDIAIMRAVTTT